MFNSRSMESSNLYMDHRNIVWCREKNKIAKIRYPLDLDFGTEIQRENVDKEGLFREK